MYVEGFKTFLATFATIQLDKHFLPALWRIINTPAAFSMNIAKKDVGEAEKYETI